MTAHSTSAAFLAIDTTKCIPHFVIFFFLQKHTLGYHHQLAV